MYLLCLCFFVYAFLGWCAGGRRRLLKAFPKMRSTAYRSIGDRLRRYLERKYR